MKKTFILFGLLLTLVCDVSAETFKTRDPHVRYSSDIQQEIFVSYEGETDPIQHINFCIKEKGFSFIAGITEYSAWLLDMFSEDFLDIFEEEGVTMVSFAIPDGDKETTWIISRYTWDENDTRYSIVLLTK